MQTALRVQSAGHVFLFLVRFFLVRFVVVIIQNKVIVSAVLTALALVLQHEDRTAAAQQHDGRQRDDRRHLIRHFSPAQ